MDKKQLLEKLRRQDFSQEILEAFEKVKREHFVPVQYQHLSYKDMALPLEEGSTISQPSTIAFMLSLLELKKFPNQKILEIGSGSGYVLALLAEITKGKIYGIEINKNLVNSSKRILAKYKNIKIIAGNKIEDLKEEIILDRILISASSEKMPTELYNKIKESGIIVVPVKNSIFQIKRLDNKITMKEFPGFIFVLLR